MPAKILVVDDEKVIRDLFDQVLKKEGYEVALAENGSEGLAAAKADQFDLALVDIKMPGMDGIELLGRIKEVKPDTEVIIVTGYGAMESAVKALELGAYDYLAKPLENIQDVLQRIKKALEKRRLTIENRKLMEDLKKRAFELSVLYDISNATSYTLDYEKLVRLILGSIYKIIDYDVSASLLLPAAAAAAAAAAGRGILIIQTGKRIKEDFIRQVKTNLIESLNALVSTPILEDNIDLMPEKEEITEGEEISGEAKSFFNIPLLLKNQPIGMINISSRKENAFSQDDIRLLYTISNQMSSAIQHLREVITAEKSKMESMVESMSEGVIMFDERGEVVVVNPRAREWFGFELSSAVETPALTQKLKEAGLDNVMAECQSKQSLCSKEIILSFKGKNVVLQCDASLVKDHEGKTLGTDIILIDITLQRELDQMKTGFISTVSHELRTPLSVVQGVISNLIDGIVGDFTPKQREYLGMANEAALRLGRLIDNLLDLSQLEARKTELHMSQVDIIATIRKCLAEIKPKADEKKIGLVENFPEQLPLIPVDEDRIKEVLINLLSNAVKFTIETGRVVVSARDLDNKEVEIKVEDTGIGIPRELLPRLFTKFYQIDRVAGPGTKGTGLGLAISKEIVELHGGHIWAESEDGKGSTFIFTLPIGMETCD